MFDPERQLNIAEAGPGLAIFSTVADQEQLVGMSRLQGLALSGAIRTIRYADAPSRQYSVTWQSGDSRTMQAMYIPDLERTDLVRRDSFAQETEAISFQELAYVPGAVKGVQTVKLNWRGSEYMYYQPSVQLDDIRGTLDEDPEWDDDEPEISEGVMVPAWDIRKIALAPNAPEVLKLAAVLTAREYTGIRANMLLGEAIATLPDSKVQRAKRSLSRTFKALVFGPEA